MWHFISGDKSHVSLSWHAANSQGHLMIIYWFGGFGDEAQICFSLQKKKSNHLSFTFSIYLWEIQMSYSSLLNLCPTFSHPQGHRSLFSAWHLSSWCNRMACFSLWQNKDLYAKPKHFMHYFRGHLLRLSYSFPFHNLSEAHKHKERCLSFRIF